MGRARLVVGYRTLFGALALFTVVYQGTWSWRNSETFRISNFLSYFTIESNLFGGTVLLLAAAAALGRGPRMRSLDYLRGAATLFLVVTGVIYAVLLAGLETPGPTAPGWLDFVLHRVMPIAILLDWLLDPPQPRLKPSRALWWLVFPFCFLAYSLLRGPVTGWYPYPFLDPSESGGYPGVTIMSVNIAVAFVILAFALVWLGNLLGSGRNLETLAADEPA